MKLNFPQKLVIDGVEYISSGAPRDAGETQGYWNKEKGFKYVHAWWKGKNPSALNCFKGRISPASLQEQAMALSGAPINSVHRVYGSSFTVGHAAGTAPHAYFLVFGAHHTADLEVDVATQRQLDEYEICEASALHGFVRR